jgi:hypothetical protein
MKTFIGWATMAFGYSVGALFAGSILYFVFIKAILDKWRVYVRKREACDLKSYTVWVKEPNMHTKAIDAVLILFNEEIVVKKSIKLDGILSITYSPHTSGHQFTLWYKKKQHVVSWWTDFASDLFAGLGNSHNFNARGNGSYFDGSGRRNFP